MHIFLDDLLANHTVHRALRNCEQKQYSNQYHSKCISIMRIYTVSYIIVHMGAVAWVTPLPSAIRCL